MSIDNTDDIIDTRDIIARIEELEQDAEFEPLDEDDAAELTRLTKWATQGDDGTWRSGVSLIHEHHFEQYARDYAEETGAISADTQWPATCIDWEQAADELCSDYTPYDLDGATYYALE